MPRAKRWPTSGICWTDKLESMLLAALARNASLVVVLGKLGIDREDVVQECRIEVWRALSLWPPVNVEISTAVYRICANHLRDLLTQCHTLSHVPETVTISLEEQIDEDGTPLLELIPDPHTNVEREVSNHLQIEYLKDYARQRYGEWLVSVIDRMLQGDSVYQASAPYGYQRTLRCLKACCALLKRSGS